MRQAAIQMLSTIKQLPPESCLRGGGGNTFLKIGFEFGFELELEPEFWGLRKPRSISSLHLNTLREKPTRLLSLLLLSRLIAYCLLLTVHRSLLLLASFIFRKETSSSSSSAGNSKVHHRHHKVSFPFARSLAVQLLREPCKHSKSPGQLKGWVVLLGVRWQLSESERRLGRPGSSLLGPLKLLPILVSQLGQPGDVRALICTREPGSRNALTIQSVRFLGFECRLLAVIEVGRGKRFPLAELTD